MNRKLYRTSLNDDEQVFFIFATDQKSAVEQIFDKEIRDSESIDVLELEFVCYEHEIINLDK